MAPSESTERFFGWLSKSNTVDLGYDFCVVSPPLRPEVVEEFDEIVGQISNLRPTLIDIKILQHAFSDVLSLRKDAVAVYGDGTHTLLSMGADTVELHALCERRLSSFLNSAHALRDRLAGKLSSSPANLSNLKAYVSSIYDESASYRLCHNLRNLSQHHASPFVTIPINGKGQDGPLEMEIELAIDRDLLIEISSRFQSRVKRELSQGTGPIDVIELSTEYYYDNLKIGFHGIALQYPNFHESIEYRNTIMGLHANMPRGAVPLIFNGKPNFENGKPVNCNITGFSFEELEMIIDIAHDIKRLEQS